MYFGLMAKIKRKTNSIRHLKLHILDNIWQCDSTKIYWLFVIEYKTECMTSVLLIESIFTWQFLFNLIYYSPKAIKHIKKHIILPLHFLPSSSYRFHNNLDLNIFLIADCLNIFQFFYHLFAMHETNSISIQIDIKYLFVELQILY